MVTFIALLIFVLIPIWYILSRFIIDNELDKPSIEKSFIEEEEFFYIDIYDDPEVSQYIIIPMSTGKKQRQ